MNNDKATNDYGSNKNRRNGLFALCLIINILLASSFGYLYYINQHLSSDLQDYNSKVNELTQTVIEYEQQLNMTLGARAVVDLEDYLHDNGFSVDVIEVETVWEAYNIFTS